MSFNKKPYFVRVEYLDTVTAEDITNGTAGNKVAKTNPDGYLPIGILPSETTTKVRTLNGLVDTVSIQGQGLVQVSSTQVGSTGTITISSLPPVFYPVAASRFVSTTGLTFTPAETGTYKTGGSLGFSTTQSCDIQMIVTGKFSGTNVQHYTPRISLNGSTYELPAMTGETVSLAYMFAGVPANPTLTGALVVRSTPSGSMTGTVTLSNVSICITALPRIS